MDDEILKNELSLDKRKLLNKYGSLGIANIIQ